MKKANLLLLSFFVLGVFLSSNLLAKFKIDFGKTKKRVEKVVADSIKQTKDSFKKVLNKASQLSQPRQESKSVSNYEKLSKVIVSKENSVIEGLDIYDIKVEKRLKKFEKCLKNIKWGKDMEFVNELNKVYKISKKQAQKVLHDKLVVAYPNSKAPLIDFVVELNKEQKVAWQYLNGLKEALQNKSKIKNAQNVEQLIKSIEKLNEIENNLEIMVTVTNQLLG